VHVLQGLPKQELLHGEVLSFLDTGSYPRILTANNLYKYE